MTLNSSGRFEVNLEFEKRKKGKRNKEGNRGEPSVHFGCAARDKPTSTRKSKQLQCHFPTPGWKIQIK